MDHRGCGFTIDSSRTQGDSIMVDRWPYGVGGQRGKYEPKLGHQTSEGGRGS